MFRTILPLVAAAVMTASAFAAGPPGAPDKAAHQAAMQKLSMMAGDWEGSGSVQMGPGPRATFTQTEHIQFKQEGTSLLVEGLGKGPSGETVHDALAVITFDQATGKYKFRSFLIGRFADTEGELNGNTFVWGLNAGPMKIRYTITIANGQWREIGERSQDGATWIPFFEMTLKRKG